MIIDEFIRKIEKVTCKKVYNTFYPLSESKDIRKRINGRNNDDTEIAELLDFFEKYLNSEIAGNNRDIREAEREQSHCYRSYEERDDSGRKTGEVIKKPKTLRKLDIVKCENDIEKATENISVLETVAEHINNSELTEEDLPILDEIMYKHKLKRSFTITTTSILLAIIAAFIIKNAFFN